MTFDRLRDLPEHRVKFIADFEGEIRGTCFIEFWERGKPSNYGLLLHPGEYCVVSVGSVLFATTMKQMRKCCFGWWPHADPRKQYRPPYWIRGGDDNAFVGVVLKLTDFARMAHDVVTDEHLQWIETERQRFIQMQCPVPPDKADVPQLPFGEMP